MSQDKAIQDAVIKELRQLVNTHTELYQSLPFAVDEIRQRNYNLLLKQCQKNTTNMYMSDTDFQFFVSEHLDTRIQLSDLNVGRLIVQYKQIKENIAQYELQYNELKEKISKQVDQLVEELPDKVCTANKELSNLCVKLKQQCYVQQDNNATPTNQETQVIAPLLEASMNASRVSQKLKHKEDANQNLEKQDQHGIIDDENDLNLDDKEQIDLDACAIPQ